MAITPVDRLEEKLRETAFSNDAVLDQLKAIAWVVDRKYRGIQVAMWAFATSAFLCAGSVLIDQLLL